MNIDSLFPSNYLKASDAEGNPTYTMQDVKIESMKNRDGEEEDKPVLYFVEVEKGMVLNRTNAQVIAGLYGDDTDNWVGERVTLTSVDVAAFGQTQPALRICTKKPGVSKQALLDRYANYMSAASRRRLKASNCTPSPPA